MLSPAISLSSIPMRIEEKILKHWIDHFYGYGSWQAKIWFVDYEEGGGEWPEEVADKINYFYKAHAGEAAALCDIRDLYKRVTLKVEGPRSNLFNNLHDYRFGEHAGLHGVWKNLIAFMHGYRNEKMPDLLSYQKNIFASPSAQREAWIHLYPLPSPHNHAWYYSWLDLPGLQFIRNRAVYQQHLYQQRIDLILSNINVYKPELILMYGMDNINALKESVQRFFPNTKFKMVKVIKQQIPQHHIADLDGTMMIITTQIPALRHNRIETGFEWEQFGRSLKI
jgi:hypothetical protein